MKIYKGEDENARNIRKASGKPARHYSEFFVIIITLFLIYVIVGNAIVYGSKRREQVTVTRKRTDPAYAREDVHMLYFISFRFPDSSEQEYQVIFSHYEDIKENDVGELTYRQRRRKDNLKPHTGAFVRFVKEASQASFNWKEYLPSKLEVVVSLTLMCLFLIGAIFVSRGLSAQEANLGPEQQEYVEVVRIDNDSTRPYRGRFINFERDP